MENLEDAYNNLEKKGFSLEDIAIGYLDEASPQTTANTVRFWHFGHGDIKKDTSKYRSITIGFYAVHGKSTIDFLCNSKKNPLQSFCLKSEKQTVVIKLLLLF